MKRIFLAIVLMSLVIISTIQAKQSDHNKVIILGSEPECIAAAVSARKLGYDVTVITESERLGGLFTEGMLTVLDINFDYNTRVLHQGFFKDFLTACSNGYNIDYKLTQNFFNSIIEKYGIRVIYRAENIRPIIDKNNVTGAAFLAEGRYQQIKGNFFIDGSSEASFTRKLGVPYKKGRAEFGQPDLAAASTLMFSVKDADWNKITDFLDNDDDERTGYKKNAAWGYNVMYKCPIKDERLQMRGLNLSRQNDGSVIINALLIFNVDPSNKSDMESAYLLAKSELPNIVKFIQKNCKGFEKASLHEVAKTLYIREGIRIVGEDTLSGTDVYEHIDFPNTIAYGSYPMDLQAVKKGEYGSALCGRCLYSIPLGTMIPKGFNNILVIGRSASFDIMAHGSARTVPVLMSMAENSVVALDYSIKKGIPINRLNRSNIDLSAFYKEIYRFNGFTRLMLPKSHLDMSWYSPYIHDLRSKGYFTMGYEAYDFDSIENTKKSINNTLTLFASHSSYTLSKPCKTLIHTLNNTIKISDLCRLSSCLLDKELKSPEDLLDQHIIDETTYYYVNHEKSLTHGEVYAVLDGILKHIYPYKPLIIYRDAENVIKE